jgi:bifunctional non-homologous end joining protein LigD
LELHSWYSRTGPEPDGHHLSSDFTGSITSLDDSLLNYPDFMVFDLDPYIYSGNEAKGAEPELNRAAHMKTCEVAGWLKEALDALSLSAFVKTSGRTGLHIYVPVVRQLDYDAIRYATEAIGRFVLAQHPNDVTMEWATVKRTGKIFLDHNQNVRGKTLASVYSPRTSPEGTVSMPLRWEELGKIYPTELTMRTAPQRLEDIGDLWADILDAKHDLQALLEFVT